MTNQGKIGVDALLQLTGSDREAKAYAFLFAAFKRTEVGNNPVRDAIDCLVPFIAPYTNSISGHTINTEKVRDYLKETFGFSFPLYAMEQLISDLPKYGLAEYNRIAKAHVAKKNSDDFVVAKAEIETDFDHIAGKLREYAVGLQFVQAPPSGSWGDALINFLKGASETKGPATVKIRNSLLDPSKSEAAVVGGFIKRLSVSDAAAFEKVLHIFMGVLIEDFISSVSELGAAENIRVDVLYDTAVLLRLLGTSGRLLRTATAELTRYLQDLGCSIYYLGGNESEVENILSTIVHIKDSGGELEGETAEAISVGEVSISEIRMLQNAFPERLAGLNVFPAENLEASAMNNARYQINEAGFSAYLLEQANSSKRAYGAQNREHDASYLGTVMRLRGGTKTRDFASAKALFVTSNKFLASTSRKYLIHDKMLHPQHFPPMMSVGQIATIAWLMKDHKLAPEKAGRELLSNCFAAVRPDAEWFRHFREGMEQATGSIEEYGKTAANTLTLQAARRIAQEESLGNATLVRELNMAEILSRAEEQRALADTQRAAELEAVRQAASSEKESLIKSADEQRVRDAEIAAAEKLEALNRAGEDARAATAEMVRSAHTAAARNSARLVLDILKLIFLTSFVVVTGWAFYLRIFAADSVEFWILSGVLAVLTIVSFANFLKIPVVTQWLANLEDWLTSKFLVRSEP